MTVNHAPLVPRQDPRAAYGDRMVAAADQVVAAAHAGDGAGLLRAVDEALTVPQPAGEDPVHWLAAALATRIPEEADDARA